MLLTTTTTCAYNNPRLYDGSIPTDSKLTWNFASSTCSTGITFSTSTGPNYINGFSYDGIITGFFLFILTAVACYSLLFFWASGIKIKK